MASSVWLPLIFTRNPIFVSRIKYLLFNLLILSKSIRLDVRRFDGLFFNLQSFMYQWYICSIQFFISCIWRCTQSQSISSWREFQQRLAPIKKFFHIVINSCICPTLYHHSYYSWCNYSINNNGKYISYCCCYSRKKSSFSCLLSFCIISCCRFNGRFYGKSFIC